MAAKHRIAAGTKQLILFAFVAITAIALAVFFASNTLSFAEGTSMQPSFTECTLLIIDFKTAPEQLSEGEIAVVDISEQDAAFDMIAHRVVENLPGQGKFSTRGDNDAFYDFPSSIDGYAPYEKYRGKVTHYLNLPTAICNIRGGENRNG